MLLDPHAMVANCTQGWFSTHSTADLEYVTRGMQGYKEMYSHGVCTPPVESLQPEVNREGGLHRDFCGTVVPIMPWSGAEGGLIPSF